MSINIKSVAGHLKGLAASAQTEVAKCRKALVGVVAIIGAIASSTFLPENIRAYADAALVIAGYLGIRQTGNKG